MKPYFCEALKGVWNKENSVYGMGGKWYNIGREQGDDVSRYPISQGEIDNIVDGDLKGVRFTVSPVYNPRIRSDGKTTAELYPWGEVRRITKIEIGKQSIEGKGYLLDTLIHEEMEARIMLGKDGKYKNVFSKGDRGIHEYIDRVIKKYFRMRGW